MRPYFPIGAKLAMEIQRVADDRFALYVTAHDGEELVHGTLRGRQIPELVLRLLEEQLALPSFPPPRHTVRVT